MTFDPREVIALFGGRVAALAILTSLAGTAGAQEAVGPEFRVNALTTDTQVWPTAAADAEGNFVVAWTSWGHAVSPLTIVGRRFGRDGLPRGPEFVANTATTATQLLPSVAVHASGAFVVTWHSTRQDGSDYGVFARRFDAAGTPLGLSEFRVNAFTTSAQRRPAAAYTTNGGFVIVWQSQGQDGSGYGIFGRRFDPTGGAVGAEFRINDHTPDAQTRPVVAKQPNGGFVVAWQSNLQDGSDYGIFARRFDSSDNPVGPEFQVNTSTTDVQRNPDIASDGSGGFVLVWTSPHLDGSQRIVGQRFDAAANRLGGQFNVTIGNAQDPPRYPAVSREPSGAFVVAWAQDGEDGDSDGIVARRFGAGGEPIGDEFVVNTFTTSYQGFPALASLGGGLFAVIWDGPAQDGSDQGIFGQRIGDLVYADGFETGDASRWSAAATDGGDLGVTGAAALKGTTFGLQAVVDDTSGLYVQDDTPSNETSYRARFYFDPGDFDPGTAQGHLRTRLFIAFEEAPVRRLIALVLRRLNGEYGLMGRTRLDDDSQANTGFFAITAGPHFVEVRWARASGPGFGDGVFELWIDGILHASSTTLDNDRSAVDFVRLGALSVKAGASGTLSFDEFESRRERPIGP